MDDLNADTAITFSMVDEPLFVTFVDPTLWETDEVAA
jgi:hypothetical protein